MTDREMRIMEEYTRALNAHTRAIERIAPALELLASKKYVDYIVTAADTNLTASRRMESSAMDFGGVVKKLEEIAQKNDAAARKMLEAAEMNSCKL